jgi:hypothetical protein
MEAMVAVRRSGTSGLGWRVASYAGAAGFFALEAVTRQPGEASDLAATPSDRGTTGLIVAAYGLAAGLSPALRRLPVGRLPAVSGPAGVAMMAAGLSLRAWSMRALGRFYSRTLCTSSDQVVMESAALPGDPAPGVSRLHHGLDRLRGGIRQRRHRFEVAVTRPRPQ